MDYYFKDITFFLKAIAHANGMDNRLTTTKNKYDLQMCEHFAKLL